MYVLTFVEAYFCELWECFKSLADSAYFFLSILTGLFFLDDLFCLLSHYISQPIAILYIWKLQFRVYCFSISIKVDRAPVYWDDMQLLRTKNECLDSDMVGVEGLTILWGTVHVREEVVEQRELTADTLVFKKIYIYFFYIITKISQLH